MGLVVALGIFVGPELLRALEDPYTVSAWQGSNLARDGRDTSTLPLFERHDCPFASEPYGRSVECATLVVPADRRAGSDPTEVIELAVAIVPAGEDPLPDPILYLEGGPGGASVGWFDAWVIDGWPSRADRDLILLDQRGTGYSSPQLGCPEYLEATAFQERSTLLACQSRFHADGIDLSTISTPEHAADVEDLRIALGVEQWNIFGTSYGSRIALRVMDQYPDGVRSVVLDSTYPPEVETFYEEAAAAEAGLTALFAACADDRRCDERFPELGAALDRGVERLDATPVMVDGLLVGGADLIFAVVQGLYDPTMIPALPAAITSVETQPQATMERLFEDLGYLASGTDRSTVPAYMESDGTYYSVECREEASTTDPTQARARAAQVPGSIGQSLSSRLELNLSICEVWDSGTADPSERDRVISDIPTLILAGALDPVTPPEWGQRALAGLSQGTFVEFSDLGHALVLGGACPIDLASGFFADPQRSVDASCAGERTVPWNLDWSP